MFAVRTSDGKKIWRARVGGGVTALAHTSQGLIIASLDNFAYLLSTRNGDRRWKTQLAGRLEAQPLVNEDTALFAPLSGDTCVVLSLRDGKPSNSLLVGDENNTSASPVFISNQLIITTRQGILAFTSANEPPRDTAQKNE
ncbi:MAG: hypothetical protein NVSMB56_11580 [Pyrinomonadaceae bacterium]